MPNGGSIIDDENGIEGAEYLFVEGKVTTTDGKPLENVMVETWETDEEGSSPVNHYPRLFSSRYGA